MKMKKYLILLAMSIVFACNGQTGYVVEGLFEDAGDGYAVLTQIGGKEKICDTVEMKNGQFEFKGKTPFVQWVFLKMVPDEKEVVETRFILENNRIKMRGDWNNIGENEEGELAVRGMTVEGSKNYDIYRQIEEVYFALLELPEFQNYVVWDKKVSENPNILNDTNVYWNFRKEYDVYMERVKKEQLAIIEANPWSEAAVYELAFLINDLDLEELERIFRNFDADVQVSEMARKVRENIELRERIEPGRQAPNFTLVQRNGTPLTLSDFRGKVVVLDFWASWCKPCRASFPWLREFYEEYQNKGVEIIGVSIDKNKTSWEKALSDEKLPWLQVLDGTLGHKEKRVGELYDVLYVPTFVLLDKEGKIVVRAHMEKEDLIKQVEEILAK